MVRVAFVQDFWFEFLGIMYISALLKQRGHSCQLFLEDRPERLLARIEDYNPQIVAFPCSTGSHPWVLKTAKSIKQKLETITVVGGPHPTFCPELIEEEGIDIVCRGEGEYALVELAEKLETREQRIEEIENLWVKRGGQIFRNQLRPLITNLDILPLPDRALYDNYSYLKNNPNRHVITSRGCPYKCTFCCNKPYADLYRGKGKFLRRSSPTRVLEEIGILKEKYRAKSIRFDDEIFTQDREWLIPFLQRYREEVGLPFTCLIRADKVEEEIILELKQAGCYLVYFGIETGNERLRNEVLKKMVSNQQIRDTARLIKKHCLKIGTFNMLGIPGETITDALETIRLNKEIGVDYLWCSIIQPYPKTELEKYCQSAGLLPHDFTYSSISPSYFSKSIIKNPQKDALENFHKLFYLAYKLPWLIPFIKLLIKLPPNRFFESIFSIFYGYRYKRTYRISFSRLLMTGLKNMRYYTKQ